MYGATLHRASCWAHGPKDTLTVPASLATGLPEELRAKIEIAPVPAGGDAAAAALARDLGLAELVSIRRRTSQPGT